MHLYPSRRTIIQGAAAATATSLLTLPAAHAHDAAALPAATPTVTARDFISQSTFLIAHRGAGAVNPEHTAYAYTEAIRKGARAVEISVRSTKDGKLVCMHDTTVERVTGTDTRAVKDMTLAELKQLRVDMKPWLGAGTPTQPISTLDEALDAIASTPAGGSYRSVGSAAILFIEPKNMGSYEGVLSTIVRRGLQKQVVLKMYRNGAGGFDPNTSLVRRAKELGLVTWCYFDKADSLDSIAAMAASPNVDSVGLPHFETVKGRTGGSMADEDVRKVVGFGKPVIVWEIHRRSDMAHFKALGVRGFMCTDPYWVSGGQPSADMAIASGRRAHGMLPAGQQIVNNMPVWRGGALVHEQAYDESVLLGPLATVAQRHSSYVMRFTLRWQDRLPSTTWQYGYIAFGRQDDEPFGVGGKHIAYSASGCYVLAVRPGAKTTDERGRTVTGDIVQLLRYDHGNTVPTVVKTIRPAKAFAPNQDIPVKIIVRPGGIVIEAAGTRTEEIKDATHRGPYVHFGRYHNNEKGGPLALHSVNAYGI